MGYGEKDVTVNIKVKDTDVDKAEVKLKRLKAAANDVGGGGQSAQANLTQQQKLANFLGKDLPQAADKATTGMKEADAAIDGVAEAASASGEAAAGAAIGIGTMVAAVAALALGLGIATALTYQFAQSAFDLAQQFAKYAIDIGNAAEATGLMTETISALKVEAKAGGRDFTDITSAVNSFRKEIGQAAAGSVEASKNLKLLGLDGKKAISDIDNSFKQAIARIVSAPDAVEKVRLAVAAFGDDGYKLIPFFEQFNGNVDEAIKKAEELGLVVSGKDVAAAREFSRAYTELQGVITGVKNTFGAEFLPIVTDALKQLGDWLKTNKGEITSWAHDAGIGLQIVIEAVKLLNNIVKNGLDDLAYYVRLLGNISTFGIYGTSVDLLKGFAPKHSVGLAGGLPPGVGGSVSPDLAATAAKQAEEEKKAKEQAEEMKKVLEAQKRQADQLKNTITDLNLQIEYFGDKTHEATVRQELAKMCIYGVNQGLAQQALDAAKALDVVEKKAAADKKAKDAAEAFRKELDGVTSSAIQQRDALNGTLQQLDQQIALGRELTVTEKQSIANKVALIEAQHKYEAEGKSTEQISQLLQELRVQQQITFEIYKQIQADQDKIAAEEKAKQHLKDFQELQKDLQDQIDEISRGGRPLSVYEETLEKINKDFSDMPEDAKNAALANAVWIDSVKELQAEYEKVKDTLKNIFDYALRGDFKGLGKSLLDSFRNSLSDKLSGALATVLTGYDPNATNNPVAKPIVKEISGTNKRLDTVIKLLGGSSGVGSGIGGGLGSILSGINGGSLGGLGGGILGDIGGHGTPGGNGQTGGGSIFDRLKTVFGTGPGGIFAPPTVSGPGSSRLSGILSGVGGIANLVGSVVPGRWGSAISGAGIGLQIGAMFGPIGAVIGAAGGFLLGLFGFNDPKKKADKEQNIPALQKGFGDSMAQLNKILDDIRHLTIDPDDAINQALAVRADIASGFGIQFQSKKYTKQAQQMIAQELTQADSIISQIRQSAEIARGAADRSKRILPEFAAGTYFADYFRPNGLLPGGFDGRDNILAMISHGEMVLNPYQQRNIRALAGFDVFAGAGIPNYPNPSASPKFASGGIAGGSGSIIVQPNFSVTLVGVPIGQHIDAYITGDDGKRQLVKVVTKETNATKR